MSAPSGKDDNSRPEDGEAQDKPLSESEKVFREFQSRLESGEDFPIDDFVKKYPHLEEELRDIFAWMKEKGDDPDQPETESLKQSRIVGDFKIIKEIGRGGMGTVYEAEQISLKRRVALKVLPSHLSFSDQAVHKFKREAEAGGRQSHPGIVAVHAVGVYEGVHYIAQELIEGSFTLADSLDEIRKSGDQPSGYFREVAKFIAEVASALQHAHVSGVIHRDIKPSNIILTGDGQPKVTDFGLAKIEDALALSRTGDFAGTPYYMSPEQAMSRRIGIDKRTDIYSLGVTLYEMLTLRRPFDGKTSHEILKKIMLVDPEEPHKANPMVPGDLSVICLKAIEKMPEKRYQSMEEFAKDLGRYLNGDVILAKPAGLVPRFWKRVKRKPVVSASLGVTFISIISFIGYELIWSIPQLKDAIEKAEERARIIKKNYDEILRLSDVKKLSDLVDEAKTLWPAYPENIVAIKNWITRAEDLTDRLNIHKQTLVKLIERAIPCMEKNAHLDYESHPNWSRIVNITEFREETIAEIETYGDNIGYDIARFSAKLQIKALDIQIAMLEKEISEWRSRRFEDTETLWQYNTLNGLVKGIEDLLDKKHGLLKDVKDRLIFAQTIEKRSIGEYREAWQNAIYSICDRKKSPDYGGLIIEHLIGYVPIGIDRDSGLWEFAHLQTGDIPERDEDGKLLITEKTGLVFVLIPGGPFNMGAVMPSEEYPLGSPNVDPDAGNDEGPIHEVTIQPFLLSKYEMTQGQWLRIVGYNPSYYYPGEFYGDIEITLLNPVEQVSWEDCVEVLDKLKLRLPSESEWEYAAKARTTTVYWTGNGKESLEGAVNLGDLYCKEEGYSSQYSFEEWLEDGHMVHAPVGSFLPNAFGLHDVYGNVYEWCQDVYECYYYTPDDGSAFELRDSYDRIFRGGCWNDPAWICRSTNRNRSGPSYNSDHIGLRPAASIQVDDEK